MTSVFKQKWRVALAAVALGSIGLTGTAFAQNTASGTTISNTATVNYTVGTIAQTPVTANATFLVDSVIRVNVDELGGRADTTVTPGQPNAYTAFTVTNTGNTPEGFQFTTADLGGSFTIGALSVFVDADADDVYDPGPGGDTATTIPTLASGASVTVFIVGNIPANATNGQNRNVRLTATARVPNTLVAWVPTAGADDPDDVDIVVSDADDDADDGYVVLSAALAVSKSSQVVWDPVNDVTDPKAIPLARVEYSITLSNTSGSAPATLVSISDPIPANTAFAPNQYPGSMDVSITVGAGAPTYCEVELGADTGDGCFITGAGALSIGTPALTTVTNGAGNDVVIRFQVTIN